MTGRRVDDPEIWADLIVAILSVGGYSVMRTFRRFEELKSEGILDPRNLSEWSVQRIVIGLGNAGYDRGPIVTSDIADRLSSLGAWYDSHADEGISEQLRSGTEREIANLLLPRKGVGPVVVRTFLTLRG